MKRALLLATLLASTALSANAAKLDITTEYRIRAMAYTNLNLDPLANVDRSFLSQSARLGFAIKNITLSDNKAEPETMDVVLKLRAIGVAGSTTSFQPPFDVIANQYPNTAFIPFMENAYVRVNNLGGYRWTFTAGRMNYTLGSGLLLDDNGAGLTGFTAKTQVPWGDFKAEAFGFSAWNSQGTPNSLTVVGLSLEKRGQDGIWQWNHLFEKDRTEQLFPVNGCAGGCLVSKVQNYFSSVRYKMRYKAIIFDGEAAIQLGAATPTGAAPLGNHITTNANAQVVRAKWKQTFYKDIRGITRIILARGSGDDPGTPTTNEAFRPSHGKRFDGLERVGFGQFFATTPYDAFGGQSTATASGLQTGASGIITVGFGITPPSYKGWVLDFDYFLYQAERNTKAARTLGSEVDFTLRYDFRERFQIHATAAFFQSGGAVSTVETTARRFMFEVTGRF
ncbi:MAG: hypothetical protein COB53_11590 [Elusimicrobia bacterium]|nr:MAG: hypothetical protein COB53_11590 [Elusimicrobiota bacterium]